MFIPRIIPCLLIRNKGLVKTVNFGDAKYVGDAINTVKIFNEKEVDELILLDILATVENFEPRLSFLKDIVSECFMPVCYGGGVRSIDQIRKLFEIGIEKISLNAAALETPELVTRASELFGSQSIVVSMDIKKNILGKYSVFSHNGKKDWHRSPIEYARQIEALGAGEILVNSITLDGTRNGYDIPTIEKMSKAIDIPLIACGGAGNLSDLKKAYEAGASALAAGSLFIFHGKHRAVLVTYPSQEEIRNVFMS